MREKKIVVPKGMLEAAAVGWSARRMTIEGRCRAVLEVALLWLSENPIVPTDGFLAEMVKLDFFGGDQWTDVQVFKFCEEWQRRMFVAPEPEVPEYFARQIAENAPADAASVTIYNAAGIEIGKIDLEAYRRGRESR